MTEAAARSGDGTSAEDAQPRDGRWARRVDEANEDTLEAAIAHQEELRERVRAQADELVDRARRSTRWIRALSLATFGVGLVLLGSALVVALPDGGDIGSVLGLGTAGTASIVAVLFYRPISRIEEATSDLAQQEALLRTWAIGVDLELMAADTYDRDSVRAAAERLRASATSLSESLQTYVEEDASLEARLRDERALPDGEDRGRGRADGGKAG